MSVDVAIILIVNHVKSLLLFLLFALNFFIVSLLFHDRWFRCRTTASLITLDWLFYPLKYLLSIQTAPKRKRVFKSLNWQIFLFFLKGFLYKVWTLLYMDAVDTHLIRNLQEWASNPQEWRFPWWNSILSIGFIEVNFKRKKSFYYLS